MYGERRDPKLEGFLSQLEGGCIGLSGSVLKSEKSELVDGCLTGEKKGDDGSGGGGLANGFPAPM